MSKKEVYGERPWVDEKLESDPEFRLSFEKEMASLNFIEQIDDALMSQGISRSSLAKRLGKSRSFVTQVLRRGSNLTIKTMVEVANELGLSLRIALRPRDGQDRRPADLSSESATSMSPELPEVLFWVAEPPSIAARWPTAASGRAWEVSVEETVPYSSVEALSS